jgi:hypothetical protein
MRRRLAQWTRRSAAIALESVERKLQCGTSFDRNWSNRGRTIMYNIRPILSLIVCTSALSGCAMSSGAPGETSEETSQAINDSVCPEDVPAVLTPDPDQTIKASLLGVGVQVYMCTATASGGFAFTFVTPFANLLNDAGRLVGTHFIGPTWQANDGSAVVAAVDQRATVDPTAIQWLLLDVTSQNGIDGRFDDVTSIQRLATVGGLAPTTGCDAAHVGSIAEAPYSAQYVFYKTKDRGRVNQCGSPEGN